MILPLKLAFYVGISLYFLPIKSIMDWEIETVLLRLREKQTFTFTNEIPFSIFLSLSSFRQTVRIDVSMLSNFCDSD